MKNQCASINNCQFMGIGIDLVEVERIRAIIRRRPRFVERVFTEAEIAQAAELSDPFQYYASRFAAKEAVIKSLGRPLSYRDIETLRVPDAPPKVDVSGETGMKFLVSLSHTRSYAVCQAVCIFDSNC